MACVENLSDRVSSHAGRGRSDGKVVPGWERTDAGFDASVLSECRSRLLEHHIEEHVCEKILTIF